MTRFVHAQPTPGVKCQTHQSSRLTSCCSCHACVCLCVCTHAHAQGTCSAAVRTGARSSLSACSSAWAPSPAVRCISTSPSASSTVRRGCSAVGVAVLERGGLLSPSQLPQLRSSKGQGGGLQSAIGALVGMVAIGIEAAGGCMASCNNDSEAVGVLGGSSRVRGALRPLAGSDGCAGGHVGADPGRRGMDCNKEQPLAAMRGR